MNDNETRTLSATIRKVLCGHIRKREALGNIVAVVKISIKRDRGRQREKWLKIRESTSVYFGLSPDELSCLSPQSSKLPVERIAQYSKLHVESIVQDSTRPAESIVQDSTLPAESIAQDSTLPAESIIQDSTLPAESITQDTHTLPT